MTCNATHMYTHMYTLVLKLPSLWRPINLYPRALFDSSDEFFLKLLLDPYCGYEVSHTIGCVCVSLPEWGCRIHIKHSLGGPHGSDRLELEM